MTTQTLAQKFAAQYAKGVVPNALTALATIKRNTKWIAMAALAVSTPHQALFIYSLGHAHDVVGIASAVFFAVMIPLVFDLGMLTMLTVTQTVGLHRDAKRRAMSVLIVLVSVSAAVNALAPGAPILRVLTGLTALVLAATEWVASAIRPDFSALEVAETEAAAPTAKATAKNSRSAAAVKGWATRKEREALEAAFNAADAPVSPAPVEFRQYL